MLLPPGLLPRVLSLFVLGEVETALSPFVLPLSGAGTLYLQTEKKIRRETKARILRTAKKSERVSWGFNRRSMPFSLGNETRIAWSFDWSRINRGEELFFGELNDYERTCRSAVDGPDADGKKVYTRNTTLVVGLWKKVAYSTTTGLFLRKRWIYWGKSLSPLPAMSMLRIVFNQIFYENTTGSLRKFF